MITFIKWLEQADNEEAIKIAIQSALGDLALGKDDSEWMDLDTKDLASHIKTAINELGILKRGHKAIEIKDAVDRGIKIKDLIALIVSPIEKHEMPMLGGEDFI